MCMIVHVPSDSETLPLDVFHELDRNNPHGIGLAHPSPTGLVVWRTMDDVRGAWERHLAAHAAGVSVTIHWRYTTHGVTNLRNVHPFPLARGGVLFHNGMLSVEPADEHMSDTAQAARDLRRLGVDPFARDAAARDAARRIIRAVGEGSRLLALSRDGDLWHCGGFLRDASGRLWSNSGCSLAPKVVFSGRSYATAEHEDARYRRWWEDADDTTRDARVPSAIMNPDAAADVRATMYGSALAFACGACRADYEITPVNYPDDLVTLDAPTCDFCGDHD